MLYLSDVALVLCCCCCCYCYCSQCTHSLSTSFSQAVGFRVRENVNGRVNKNRWHIWKSTHRSRTRTRWSLHQVSYLLGSIMCWLCVLPPRLLPHSLSLYGCGCVSLCLVSWRCDCGWALGLLTHNFQLFQIVVDEEWNGDGGGWCTVLYTYIHSTIYIPYHTIARCTETIYKWIVWIVKELKATTVYVRM